MFKVKYRLMEETTGDDTGGGAATVTDPADTTTTTAPASTTAAPEKTDPASTTTTPATTAPAEVKGNWPENWQTLASKGDAKKLAALGRYASPEAMADALIAAQNRIRSGELKTALPKDAKPEELKAWRAENGIPETADKYDLKFDSGLVIGKEDRPVIDGFLATAHENNVHPDQAKGVIEWYYGEQERQTAERHALDDDQKRTATDALNAEYGSEFRGNINAMEGLLSTFPESVRNAMRGARLPDGTGLFNSVDVIRGFVQLAKEINPAATLVPGGGGDAQKGIGDRIAQIEKVMTDNRKAYDKDEKMQAELRQLYASREKLAARNKAA